MITDIMVRVAIAMLIFVPLEHVLPRKRDKRILRKFWTLDAVYALAGGVLNIAGSTVVIILGLVLLQPLIPAALQEVVAQQPLILQAIQVMILADLGYYAIHRLFHTVPFLWQFHAIHHSIEEMDWLAAHRVHPVDQILTRGASMILPLALGFSTAAIGIFVFIFGWHSYLKHSNVNVNFGPLRWIFVSPAFHHWHHANEPHAFDKNFAGQFSFLDRLFGTALMTDPVTPRVYGTDTPVPDGFVSQLVAPLKGLGSDQTTVATSTVPDAQNPA